MKSKNVWFSVFHDDFQGRDDSHICVKSTLQFEYKSSLKSSSFGWWKQQLSKSIQSLSQRVQSSLSTCVKKNIETLKRHKYLTKKYGTIGNTPIDFYWNELTLWKVSTICYIKLVEKWRAKMLNFTFSMIFKAVSTPIYASNRHNVKNTFHYSNLLLPDRENSNSLSLFNLSQDASKVHYRHENSTRR